MEILITFCIIVSVLVLLCSLVVIGTLKVGEHYVNNYVEKMTPEKLKALDGVDSGYPHSEDRMYIPEEETLWARGMTKNDVDSYYDKYSREGDV